MIPYLELKHISTGFSCIAVINGPNPKVRCSKDPAKRQRYDAYGHAGVDGQGAGGFSGGGFGGGAGDPFAEFFRQTQVITLIL